MSAPLTAPQLRLLGVIRSHITATGVAPTVGEMCQAMGVKSKSVIHRHLTCMEDRGAIRRLPFRARAIEIVEPRSVTLDAVLAAVRSFCDAEGIPPFDPIFGRLRVHLRQRLGAAQGGL